jgi:ABC-type cobalamin/Fe3+-siderophores transport system ATPase subunit
MEIRMKKAEIRDYWGKLAKVPRTANGISRITQAVSESRKMTVDTQGLFCVVGANGAGKSSFFQFLSDVDYQRLNFSPHEVYLSDGEIKYIPGAAVEAILIEPLSQLTELNRSLKQFESTFGQAGELELKGKELGLINYVLGSNYESIKIEEVEAEDGKVTPRFVFGRGGDEYDNFSLSLGEQLVIFIFWVLAKRHVGPGLFFLEEPETGLSPAAQSRIVDLLAYLASDNGKQIFISTHSPFVVEALGTENVIVMKRPLGAEWHEARNNIHLDELGMAPVKKGIFFFEDNKAKIFFERLLDIYGSSLRKTHDKAFLGGESNVYAVVSRTSSQGCSLNIIGILDADQRADPKYSAACFKFLPGSRPPEEEAMQALKSDIQMGARVLGVRPDKLSDALRRCQGFELHDAFEEVSRDLYGEVKLTVFEAAFDVWFHNYADKDEIDRFMQSIDPEITSDDIQTVRSNELFENNAQAIGPT